MLRAETVINHPEEFRIRRRVRRHGRSVIAWVPLRKGVAYLSRYQEICGQCNCRYLDALAHVDDPTPARRALDSLSARAATPDGRTVRPFNPVARHERTLFRPDGYVGLRADRNHLDALASYRALLVSGRTLR